MTQPAKSHEPSMEEILASIRRIIADDDVAKPVGPASADAAAETAASEPQSGHELPNVAPMALVQELEPVVTHVPPPPQPSPAEANDILELTDDMRAPAPQPFRTIDAQPDVMFAEPETEPQAQPDWRAEAEPRPVHTQSREAALEEARRTLREQMDGPLLSQTASAAVDSAFASLAHTVLTHNARTLDDLVKDMLRPMLKSWLDDNLPGLVERLVRAEIERVSRGR